MPVDQGTDLELGGTEQVGGFCFNQGSCHLQQFVFADLGQSDCHFLDLGLSFRKECVLHGRFSDHGDSFLAETPCPAPVYKYSTNFPDAHTTQGYRSHFACL